MLGRLGTALAWVRIAVRVHVVQPTAHRALRKQCAVGSVNREKAVAHGYGSCGNAPSAGAECESAINTLTRIARMPSAKSPMNEFMCDTP